MKLFLPIYARLDEGGEKRMGGKRAGFEFGMKLGAKIKRVGAFGQLGNFHQNSVWGSTGKNQSGLLQLGDIFGVDLVAMTMPFGNFRRFISIFRDASLF